MKMDSSKRLNYIDVAKGLAVLTVIFGHTFRQSMRTDFAWCDFSYLFVYKFHVSLLFVLSGMGYGLTGNKNLELGTAAYLKKKAKSLILPWFTYSVLIYAVFGAVQLIPGLGELLAQSDYSFISPGSFALAMLKNDNPYCFHVWYLQTLFLFSCTAFLADRLLMKRSMKTAAVLKIAAIVIAPAFYMLFCEGFIWTFKAFFQKLIFFLLGTVVTDGFIRKNSVWLSICGLICGMYLAITTVFPLTGLYDKLYTGLPMFYLDNAAVFGFCLGIIAVCSVAEKYLVRFASFGRHTMPYYLYHQPFCCAFLGIVLYEKLHLPAPVTVTVCMLAGLAVPYAVIRLVKAVGMQSVMDRIGLPTR